MHLCIHIAGARLSIFNIDIELDTPIPGFENVKPWMPRLKIGYQADPYALQANVRKEFSTRRNGSQRRSRALRQVDQQRLEASIAADAHHGLRMLCGGDSGAPAMYGCTVHTSQDEYACVILKDIRLDIEKIQELVSCGITFRFPSDYISDC